MAAPKVRLVPLDPYDGKTGVLIPFVLDRIRTMALTHNREGDPDQAMVGIGSRVYNQDPSIKLVAFLDERSKLVGHAVASIETDGVRHWLFISQVGMDPGEWGDAVVRALEMADQWAQDFSTAYLLPRKKEPIREMLMATKRDDRAWQRKFGFQFLRYIMVREIGTKGKEE